MVPTSHGWGWASSLWKFPGWCLELVLVFLKGSAMSSSVLTVSVGLVWFGAAYLLMGRLFPALLKVRNWWWKCDVYSRERERRIPPEPCLWFWLDAASWVLRQHNIRPPNPLSWSPQGTVLADHPLIYHFYATRKFQFPTALGHKKAVPSKGLLRSPGNGT